MKQAVLGGLVALAGLSKPAQSFYLPGEFDTSDATYFTLNVKMKHRIIA